VRVSNTSGHAAGLLGLISGAFGIDGAACGTVIISSVFVMFGVGGLLAALAFNGAEFGVLGMILPGFFIYQLSKRINDLLVCPS